MASSSTHRSTEMTTRPATANTAWKATTKEKEKVFLVEKKVTMATKRARELQKMRGIKATEGLREGKSMVL